MNIDINNIDPKLLEEDDRIVAYLKGQMSAEEEQKFLEKVEHDPELKEKAVTLARLVKGLKEVGIEQDRDIQRVVLASSKQDLELATKNATRDDFEVAGVPRTKAISISKTTKWLSIAASLICIVWFGLSYNSYRNTIALGDQYDDLFNTGMIVRGQETQTEVEKKLQKLFTNVKDNENIDGVIHELLLCWELSTMDTYNDYTDYSSEIGWNLAIAYLKNNDKKEAKVVLEKLISSVEEDSFISKKAKELQSKI